MQNTEEDGFSDFFLNDIIIHYVSFFLNKKITLPSSKTVGKPKKSF